MGQFILSPPAFQDIESILRWSEDTFGESASLRYEILLKTAMRDVAKEPYRTGSMDRGNLVPQVRTYHLFHSRNHVKPKLNRVKHPRHFLLYRVLQHGVVDILRILHERMDLLPQIPSDFSDG